ncbi:MAG TPA: damage-inducible protein, partial [Stellaceae bacterium]|nr:damage-inducible protein [Stellaceae bacterium]
LAAEGSGVTAFLLRRWRHGALAARERDVPQAAMTRWRIAAIPSESREGEPGVGRARWRVELRRCRGGTPGTWEVEAGDATGHVSLVAALADRKMAAATPGAAFG